MIKKLILLSPLLIFAILSILGAGVLFSSGRDWVRYRVFSQERTMLSVVYGDLMHNGSSIKVVKFKTIEGIVLEFYSDFQDGSRYLITRVVIPNARDGFFDHRGDAVQLAVADVDGDGKMELLSPTFDDTMFARLNPYRYSFEEEGFVPWMQSF